MNIYIYTFQTGEVLKSLNFNPEAEFLECIRVNTETDEVYEHVSGEWCKVDFIGAVA